MEPSPDGDQRAIEIEGLPSFAHRPPVEPRSGPAPRIEPRFQITASGVQWFDLGVVFESTGGEKFSAADIQRLVLGGQGHTRLRNGKMAVIDTGAVEEL